MKNSFMLLSAVSVSALLSACGNMGHDSSMEQRNNPNMCQNWKAEHANMLTEYYFNQMDANGDGMITLKEFVNYQRKKFHEADTNHDGKLTMDEAKAQAKREREEIMEWKRSQRNENQNDGGNIQQRDTDYEGASTLNSNMNQGTRY